MSNIVPLSHVISGTSNQSYDIDASTVAADGFNPVHIETNIQLPLQELNVNATQNDTQVATPQEGYYGFSKVNVTVNVPPIININYLNFNSSNFVSLNECQVLTYTDGHSITLPGRSYVIWIYALQGAYLFDLIANTSSDSKAVTTRLTYQLPSGTKYLQNISTISGSSPYYIYFYQSPNSSDGVFALYCNGNASSHFISQLSSTFFKIPFLDSA